MVCRTCSLANVPNTTRMDESSRTWGALGEWTRVHVCGPFGTSAVSHRADDWRNKVLLVHAQHDGVCDCACALFRQALPLARCETALAPPFHPTFPTLPSSNIMLRFGDYVIRMGPMYGCRVWQRCRWVAGEPFTTFKLKKSFITNLLGHSVTSWATSTQLSRFNQDSTTLSSSQHNSCTLL